MDAIKQMDSKETINLTNILQSIMKMQETLDNTLKKNRELKELKIKKRNGK
jgi:hypothetical protein